MYIRFFSGDAISQPIIY